MMTRRGAHRALNIQEEEETQMTSIHRSHAIGRWTVALVCCAAVATATAQIVTVDNSDPGFSTLYGDWHTGAYGSPYGDNYNWASTTDAPPAMAEWRPNLPTSAPYIVAIWYVQGPNRTNNART